MTDNHFFRLQGMVGCLLALAIAAAPLHAEEGVDGIPPADAQSKSPAPGVKRDRAKVSSAKKAALPVPPIPKRGSDRGASLDAHDLVALTNAPFPVLPDARIPGTSEPFFSTDEGGRFHVAPRGGKLYEAGHYDDPRSLVVVPPGFDPRKPAVLLVFFHGNLATLARDVVRRQKVIEQVERSGLNALFVAPQLVVDALDSSPGRFYDKGFLDLYLAEAATQLAARCGNRITAEAIGKLPLLLVSYSGGYLATAYALPQQSGTLRRITGVVLLDALFGEEEKFAAWIEATHERAFFVSAYSAASAGLNAKLAADVSAEKPAVQHKLPESLQAGDIVLLPARASVHNDFMTAAWTTNPLEKLLRLVARGMAAGARPRPITTDVAVPSACPADEPDCRATPQTR